MGTWALDPECTIENPEVRALLLGTDLEVWTHLAGIASQRCANCGGAATAVRSSLDGQAKTFLCECCLTVV